MEDDWIFLGDNAGAASYSDSASEDGSDSDSGFTVVRRGSKRGDAGCSVVVSNDAPWVAAVAVPQPTPPGLYTKVMSYAEAFSTSASSSSSEDGGGREQPGCNDEATAGEAIIVQGAAGIDGAAGTGSSDDDCTVTCKDRCESDSDQVGKHDGTGSSVEAASVAVVSAAPTANCPETTSVLHGEAHSELASGMDVDQGGADEVEDEDDSDNCEEDADDDTENSSEDEDEDTDNSSEEDMHISSEDDDTDSSSDEDMDSSSDEDTDSSSEDEDEDTFSSSDEEYTESFSEEEYTMEICSEEEEEDDDDAECSGEEEEEDGEVEYENMESSGEEHDADNTGEEEDDDTEISGEEQEQEEEDDDDDDDAECSGEVDDMESTGEEEDAENTGEEGNDDDDSEISGEEESVTECSGGEDDVESSGDESDDPESSGADSDDDAESHGDEAEEEEDAESCGEEEEGQEEDTVSAGEEESSHVVDVAENGEKDIFAMLLPKAKKTNAEQGTANANGTVKELSESFPSKYDNMDTDTSNSGSDMDTDSSDMEDDDDCLESYKGDDTVGVAENGNRDIFAMLFPKAKACGANMDDHEDESEHGNIDDYEEEEYGLFDMLLPRGHATGDDIDTDSSGMEDNCLESDEEDDTVGVADNINQGIFAMLLPKEKASGANMDDHEDKNEHGNIDDCEKEEDESLFDMLLSMNFAIDDDIDNSDGEGEAATATATVPCGYSAEPSHGTRRPEFAGRAARCYDDVDIDSDTEEEDGDDEVAADVNGTILESQHSGFASRIQAERQALWNDLRRVPEDLQRQLAAEALESSPQQQQRSYDDVDDTCDVPGKAAPGGGGPAGSCARTAEAQFTARAEPDTERELAMEEARRREAAQRELDRALEREAAAAAEVLESALKDCATADRQATGDVTRPAIAKRDVPADFTFIIGVYVFVFLVVHLLSLALPSN